MKLFAAKQQSGAMVFFRNEDMSDFPFARLKADHVDYPADGDRHVTIKGQLHDMTLLQPTPELVSFRTMGTGDDCETIAVFPGIQASASAYHCQVYAHMGQHSAGDAQHIIRSSRPATADEAEKLRNELEGLGYILKSISRIPQQAYWYANKLSGQPAASPSP